MSLKTKIIGAVVALALASPSAFAVEGSDGMHYTSASEGFYASIRLRFNSGGSDADNGSIGNQSSRLGVQGTGEMSHGLEGFYRYETAFDVDNDAQGFVDTRLGYVGLRGGFGSVRVGSDWADEYNWVYGSTDIANVNSGNFAYNDDYAGRSKRSIFYQSPDFNGLRVAARFEIDGGKDATNGKESFLKAAGGTETSPGAYSLTEANIIAAINAHDDGLAGYEKDLAKAENAAIGDPELDAWVLAAKYEFNGFTVAGAYTARPDYGYIVRSVSSGGMLTADNFTGVEDLQTWAIRGSYGQDNWGVSTWYGENNASDFSDANAGADDETVFSIAGNVSIGKTGIYVVHETKELNYVQLTKDMSGNVTAFEGKTGDNAYTTFGVEYRLNSKAKTWIEYAAQDLDSNTDKDSYVTIGLRHDF